MASIFYLITLNLSFSAAAVSRKGRYGESFDCGKGEIRNKE